MSKEITSRGKLSETELGEVAVTRSDSARGVCDVGEVVPAEVSPSGSGVGVGVLTSDDDVVDCTTEDGLSEFAVDGAFKDVGWGGCRSFVPSLARVDEGALRDGGGARSLAAAFLVVARVDEVSDGVREDSVDSADDIFFVVKD